jgi:hypothetical protein
MKSRSSDCVPLCRVIHHPKKHLRNIYLLCKRRQGHIYYLRCGFLWIIFPFQINKQTYASFCMVESVSHTMKHCLSKTPSLQSPLSPFFEESEMRALWFCILHTLCQTEVSRWTHQVLRDGLFLLFAHEQRLAYTHFPPYWSPSRCQWWWKKAFLTREQIKGHARERKAHKNGRPESASFR